MAIMKEEKKVFVPYVEYDSAGRIVALRNPDGTTNEGADPEWYRQEASRHDTWYQEAVEAGKPHADRERVYASANRQKADVLEQWYEHAELHGLERLSRAEGAHEWQNARRAVQKEHPELADFSFYLAGDLQTGADFEEWQKSWKTLFRLVEERLRLWNVVMFPFTTLHPLPREMFAGRGYEEVAFPAEKWAFLRVPEDMPIPTFGDGSGVQGAEHQVPGYIMMPTTRGISAVHESIYSSNWEGGEEGPRYFPKTNDPTIVTYYQEDLPLEKLHERARRMGLPTAKVLDYVLNRFMTEITDVPTGMAAPVVTIHTAETADALGYAKHHKGGHTVKTKREIGRAIEDLSRLYMSIPGMNTTDDTRDVPLLMLTERLRTTEDGRTEEYPKRYELQVGKWYYILPRQYILKPESFYKKTKWVYALGHVLYEHFRINQKHQRTEEKLKVGTLINMMGGLSESDRKNASRTRERFEDALGELTELDGGKEFADWRYDTEPPGTGRGWFDEWLETTVVVTKGEELQKRLVFTKGKKKVLA